MNENILQVVLLMPSMSIEKLGTKNPFNSQPNNDIISRIATNDKNVTVLFFLISSLVRKITKVKVLPIKPNMIKIKQMYD